MDVPKTGTNTLLQRVEVKKVDILIAYYVAAEAGKSSTSNSSCSVKICND